MTSPRRTERLGLALLVAAWALLVERLWFVCDDAYISFRYARNQLMGEGLRYNLWEGPPVEGYSNFLWVELSAALQALGLPVASITAFSVLAGGLLLWRVHRRGGLLAVAFLALCPAFAAWSSSGLETLPFALLLLLSWELLEARSPWAGLALLALTLLRSEGLLWAGGLLALRFQGRALALLAAGALPWLAWRFAYYGEHVANTAAVKVALGPEVLLRGLRYLGWNALALLTPLLALAGLRRERLTLLVLAVLAFPVLVGGDFMPFGRFLVPALPLLALAYARLPRTLAWGALPLGLLCAFGWQVTPRALWFRQPEQAPYSELEMLRRERDQVPVLLAVGRAVEAAAQPGDSLSAGAIGAVGWASKVTVYDRYGLVTPEVAHRTVDHLWMPGHDKRVGPFFFASHRPTWLFAAFVDEALAPDFARDLHAQGLDQDYEAGWLPAEGAPLFVLQRRDRAR